MAPSQSVSQSNSELLRVEGIVGQTKERKSKGEAKRGEDEREKLRDQMGGHAFAINRRKMDSTRTRPANEFKCIANKLLARTFHYRQIFSIANASQHSTRTRTLSPNPIHSVFFHSFEMK